MSVKRAKKVFNMRKRRKEKSDRKANENYRKAFKAYKEILLAKYFPEEIAEEKAVVDAGVVK